MSGAIRVLLVEDNPGDARLIAETIREVSNASFALVTVSTLAQAVAVREQHDVILLDLSLPDARGLEALQRMTNGPSITPVVVLTGNNDDELARRAMQAGAQDYLVKGQVSPELLARTLRYAIERRRAEEDALIARGARRARFLFDVGTELAMSLDIHEMGDRLAKFLVPALGDACKVEVVSCDGARECVGVAAVDDALKHEIESGAAEPTVLSPLRVRDRSVGTLALFHRERAAGLADDDRLLVEEIASRAALSIENARLYRDAQQALHARDEMLAVVSHDLRNPLAVVGLSLRLLKPAVATDAARSATLGRAQNAFERMNRLIEDLLDLARIDQGTLRVERVRQQLGPVLQEHVEAQRALAEDRGINLELVTVPDALVDVDRDRIGQLLANLLGNALKFTPRGGTVTVRAHCVGRVVHVEVEDTGRGIPADMLPRVFERFFQSSTAHARQGVGLGLAIAKGIVEAHGGTIDVVSPPGAGATFRFRLPLASVVESRDAIAAP